MNFFTKLKKKSKGKKAKAAKKKLVTAGEFFIAGGLLTAGGNLVDSITEDSSATQISANEVNYVEDKTKTLLEIKTNQRDSISSFPWGILGYILLGLGMILMAIPALRLIRWIRASCGSGNDSIHEEKDIEEPSTKMNQVKYRPDPEERLEYGSGQPMPSLSQKLQMLEQEARTNIKDPVL